MNNSITHRCLFRGCSTPPTKVIESDVGLDGTLNLYFCADHEEAFRTGKTEQFDLDRTEPESGEQPQT